MADAAAQISSMTQNGRTVPVKVCFIDCDGIIFDSNNLKTTAYRQTLQDMGVEPPMVEEFIKLHLADVAVSRFVKYRRFFTEIHQVPDPEASAAEACHRFHELCLKIYAELEPQADALALARRFEHIFVVSGGAQDELRTVFAEQKIDSLFSGIHGSPTTKPEHCKALMEQLGVTPADCVFIGDGFTDYKTARALNMHFVFLRAMSDWHLAEEQMSESSPAEVTKCETWPEILRLFQ